MKTNALSLKFHGGQIMYKIAILGCEKSHTNTFLEFIKEDETFLDV